MRKNEEIPFLRMKTSSKMSILSRVLAADSWVSLHLYTSSQSLLLKSLEISGDGFLFFPFVISILLYSHSHVAPYLLLGGILDLAIIGTLKHLIRRPRPHYNANMKVAFEVDHFSFPSGHSSRVFFVATFLHRARNGPLTPAIWAWAGMTSISRILMGRHFMLDVIVGMLIGILQGIFVFRIFNAGNLVALAFPQQT